MMLGRRLPAWKEVAAVYGIAVLIIYAWSLVWFFWKYPSWILFLNSGEIYALLAYVLTVNFMESLFVLFFPIAASIFLPLKWFHDQFIARGSALVISILVFFILMANQFDGRTKFNQNLIELLIIPYTIFTLFFVFAAGKNIIMHTVIENIADRTIVFIYISGFLSIISLITVIIRNLY